MKGRWRYFVSGLMLLLCVLVLVACEFGNSAGNEGTSNVGGGDNNPSANQTVGGTSNTNLPDSHECEYTLQSSKEMTCTEDGVKIYICSCGNTYTETTTATHMTLSVEPQVDATCTAKGKTKREVCTICQTVVTESVEIPMLPHQEAVEAAVASTCEVAGKAERKYCTVCKNTLSGGEALALAPHTEVTDPAVPETATTPAKTEGKHCSVCGTVTVRQQFIYANDYKNPDKYDGIYAYQSLASLANGAKMQAFYAVIDGAADEFHSSGASAANDRVVATLDYASVGLTTDEALAVWSAYRLDHPLYYWIANDIEHNSTSILLKVSEEYRDGNVRNAYNAAVYERAQRMIESADGETIYEILLSFHDAIIKGADYAYVPGTNQPSGAAGAHNILGVLCLGSGVCESYAEAFQMLLNYCGVENVIVTGVGVTNTGSEAHAWNLVKLDDGKWYWFDLTWDDTPEFFLGVSYTYFCVENDEADVKGFEKTHLPATPTGNGTAFAYAIPARATTAFDAEALMPYETFSVDGFTYALVCDGGVQVISIAKTGAVEIPTSVIFDGKTFDVVSIGRMTDGEFALGCVAYQQMGGYTEPLEITSITLPASVCFIWEKAFEINALTAFEVAAENTHFAAVDGVLYNKDLTVLIKYPTGKNGTSYTVADSVRWIAVGAFSNYYSNVKLSLLGITLGANTEAVCIFNHGGGYETATGSNTTAQEWQVIRSYLDGEAIIYAANGTVFDENAA